MEKEREAARQAIQEKRELVARLEEEKEKARALREYQK